MKKIIFLTLIMCFTFGSVNVYAVNYSKMKIYFKDDEIEIYDETQYTEQNIADNAEAAGELDGANVGYYDYKNKTARDAERAYRDYYDIAVENYELNKKSQSYKDMFLKQYKIFFLSSYDATYVRGKVIDEEIKALAKGENVEEVEILVLSDGSAQGGALGGPIGQKYALEDFYNDKTRSAERAYNEFVNTVNSVSIYANLDRFEPLYRYNFEKEFIAKFYEQYDKTYSDRMTEYSTANVSGLLLSSSENTYIYSQQKMGISQGSTQSFGSVPIAVYTPAGTLYGESYLSITQKLNSYNYDSENRISASEVYDIQPYNYIDNMKNRYITTYQEMEIHMQYVGSDRVGIYKYDSNKWVYQPTKFKGDYVYTTIPKGKYYGGTYALFIDNNFSYPIDMQSSWANDELYVYVRRGYITQNSKGYIYPENNISRGDFAYLLEKNINKVGINYQSQAEAFADSGTFGKNKNAIGFVSTNKLMYGTGDNMFSPYAPITYAQMEAVLSRQLNRTFKFDEVAEAMKYTDYHKSKGEDNKNLYVTRADAVYTLLYLYK